MEKITVTQNGFNDGYIPYLYDKLRKRFSFLESGLCLRGVDGADKTWDDCASNGANVEKKCGVGGRNEDEAELCLQVENAYCPYVRGYLEDVLADILAVGYKYAFFKRRALVPLLKKEERYLLLTAMVSADYKEDKAYIKRGLRGQKNYCIDGFYAFRLRELQKRWGQILEYLPSTLTSRGVEEFVDCLIEDSDGNVFVKDGNVYDGEYRVLSRSVLTGQKSIIGEILLYGARNFARRGKFI